MTMVSGRSCGGRGLAPLELLPRLGLYTRTRSRRLHDAGKTIHEVPISIHRDKKRLTRINKHFSLIFQPDNDITRIPVVLDPAPINHDLGSALSTQVSTLSYKLSALPSPLYGFEDRPASRLHVRPIIKVHLLLSRGHTDQEFIRVDPTGRAVATDRHVAGLRIRRREPKRVRIDATAIGTRRVGTSEFRWIRHRSLSPRPSVLNTHVSALACQPPALSLQRQLACLSRGTAARTPPSFVCIDIRTHMG